MGLKRTSISARPYVLPAITSRYLEMTLLSRPDRRLQRYRLTEQGQLWLRAQGEGGGRYEKIHGVHIQDPGIRNAK